MGYFIPVSILSLQKGDVNGENFKRIEFSLFIIKIRSHYVLSGCEWGHTGLVVIFSEYFLWMDWALSLKLFVNSVLWALGLNAESFRSFFCRSDIQFAMVALALGWCVVLMSSHTGHTGSGYRT